MKARTHDVAAATALLGAVVVMPDPPTITLATAVAVIIANQFGGIVPDIDQPTAPLWRNLPIGGIFGRMVAKMLGGHRFITHSLLGVALAGFLFNMLLALLHPIMPSVQTELVWWAFMIGMVSHLIMDTFTKEGVPWLLPLPIKIGLPPLRRFRITTGTWSESFITLPLLVVIVGVLCAYNYNEIAFLLHNNIVR
jgi:inner membrane protein